MTGEVICPGGEPITVLLKGHIIKLLSKHLHAHSQSNAAPSLGKRSFFGSGQQSMNTLILVKMLRISDSSKLNTKNDICITSFKAQQTSQKRE